MAAISTPLDSVIRKVTARATPEPWQRVVIIDARKKRAVPRRGLLGEYHYYLVSNVDDPDSEAQVQMLVPLSDLDYRDEVGIILRLACPPEHEQRVAEALFDPSRSPEDVLRRLLPRWLMEGAATQTVEGFITAWYGDAEKVRDGVAAAISRATGLRAAVKLRLRSEQYLNLIRVERHVPVRVRDYDQEQDLAVRADLEVDEQNRAAAALYASRQRPPAAGISENGAGASRAPGGAAPAGAGAKGAAGAHAPGGGAHDAEQPSAHAELHELVPREIARYVRANLTLQEFCTTAGSAAAWEALTEQLNRALEGTGRKVGVLVLRGRASGENTQPNVPPIEMSVSCKVHEFPQEIVIANKVLLKLTDLARYRAAGSPELRDWLQKKLSSVIPRLLFDVRYIDLLIRFGPVEQQIKEELAREAAAIGYEIRQFVTVPDLPPIRLRDPFTLQPVGTFETRLRDVQVKLQVVVTARIPDLEAIESRLNRHEDVPAQMEKTILDAIRERMHGIDPERFYLRFTFTDRADEERSVEAELLELIQARLEKDFHADVSGIVIKIVDTDLIERFKKLREGICPFQVAVSSLWGGEKIVFRGEFRVVNVHTDYWHEFQLLNLGLEQIRDQLQTHLLSLLQTKRSDALRFKEDGERDEIEAYLSDRVRHYAASNFGLIIQLTNVRRELTEVEAEVSADLTDEMRTAVELSSEKRRRLLQAQIAVHDSRLSEIEELITSRGAAVAADAGDDEITALDRKIEERARSLGVDEILPMDRVRTRVLGAPDAPLALAAGTEEAETAAAPRTPEEAPGEAAAEIRP